MPRRDDTGASSVEYGILLAALVIIIIAGVTAFSLQVGGIFDGSFARISSCLDASC